MREYSFNVNLNILELEAKGDMRIEDLIDHYKNILKKKSLPKRLKVLIDCREANFIINPEEIKLTSSYLKDAVCKFEVLSEAIIVDKPFTTVVATLFKNDSILENYSFEVFSTKNAALSWLNNK